MFLNGRNGLHWVKNQLAEKCDATLAVAFWGEGAIRELGLDKRSTSSGPVSIICNLKMGGTNPHEIARLQDIPGLKVQQCDKLHGKIYLFMDKAMVGSSNASANGLSFQGEDALGWDEANIVVSEPAEISSIRDWIAHLECRKINCKDIEEAKAAWVARRRAISTTVVERSIEDVLNDGSAALAGRGVYVVASQAPLSEDGEAALKEAKTIYGKSVDGYEGFAELPDDGILICFWRGPRGGLTYDGSYNRVGTIEDLPNFQLCFRTKLPLGLKSPNRDMSAWKAVVDRLIEREGVVDQDNARFCDISELC